MNKGFFITGTDTEVGKTYVSCALLAAFNQKGYRTAAMKPVASDCYETEDGLRNDDAVQLQSNCSVDIPYTQLNPYRFAEPIAPHIAAEEEGVEINLDHLRETYKAIASQAEVTLAEGAGGWLVPLNENESIADLASHLSLPVVLVVGVRLGCINHALLSAESIRSRGLTLAGWVANCVDPNASKVDKNIESITQRINAPLIGILPFAPEHSARERVESLDIDVLI